LLQEDLSSLIFKDLGFLLLVRHVLIEMLSSIRRRWPFLVAYRLIFVHQKARSKLLLDLRRHLAQICLMNSPVLAHIFVSNDLDVVLGKDVLLFLLLDLVLFEE